MSYLSTNEAYDYATLACWYQNSIDETVPPIWTDEHLEELLKDFYVIPKGTPTADVVPKSEVDNLKVLLEMKEKAYEGLKELYDTDTEALVKAREKTEVEVAREIFGEIESVLTRFAYPSLTAIGNIQVITAEGWHIRADDYRTIKKKYTEVR